MQFIGLRKGVMKFLGLTLGLQNVIRVLKSPLHHLYVIIYVTYKWPVLKVTTIIYTSDAPNVFTIFGANEKTIVSSML